MHADETMGRACSVLPVDFLEDCRLPNVELRPHGFCTAGFLWELQAEDQIYSGAFALPSISRSKRAYLAANPWDALELQRLVAALEERHPVHAEKLRRWIVGTRPEVRVKARIHVDRMVRRLVEAIEN